jgi:hypothetical protein
MLSPSFPFAVFSLVILSIKLGIISAVETLVKEAVNKE